MVPIVPLVNIDVYAGARMVFFDDHRTRMVFHDDCGTTFFYDYGRCGCGRRCVSGRGGHWRRRLRT
jgi:hypothetical protein